MKNLSFIFALILYVCVAQSANAVEVYKSKKLNLEIFGDIGIGLFIGKQDEFIDDDGNPIAPATTQFRADGVIGADAYAILPNGYKVGGLAEIEITGEVETFYLYLAGAFGELKMGQSDNVTSDLHLSVPGYLAPGLDSVDWSYFIFNGRNSVGEGLQVGDSTFYTYDDVAFQVVYLSPTIQGFTFGVSWTPDPCLNAASDEQLARKGGASDSDSECGKDISDEDKNYLITDVTTIAAQFARAERSGLAWGLSASYLTGNRSTGGAPYGYSLGANFRFEGWELGGAWQNSRNLNGANLEDRVWVAGLTYHQDDWRIGGAYRQSRRAFYDGDTKTNREVEIGLSYDLGENFWASLAFEYIWDEDRRAEDITAKSYGGALFLSYEF